MGNAATCTGRSRRSTVHPHVHGERKNKVDHYHISFGSSPRTWGTPQIQNKPHSRCRFIPTYMGNAVCFAIELGFNPVHPHVHGERGRGEIVDYKKAGSSPRTWGTRRGAGPGRLLDRFIPTYMGNACAICNKSNREPGSSPRTWGTPSPHVFIPLQKRFIPTYMGNAHPFLFQKGGRLLPPAQAEDQEIVTGSRLPHLPHSGLSNEPHSIPSSLSSPAITPAESLPGTGRNDTSLTPSNSTGTRRFVPSVVKS